MVSPHDKRASELASRRGLRRRGGQQGGRSAPVQVEEGLHDTGREFAPGAKADLLERELRRKYGLVRARGDDAVEGIEQADDLRAESDVVAEQPGGIAGAVEPLVVLTHERGDVAQGVRRLERLRTELGMRAQLHELTGLQGLALREDALGDPQLADVA